MSLLIIGANGQLGKTLQNVLTDNITQPVYALTHNQLDITNKQAIKNIFSAYKPKFVINAAAFTAVDAAESQRELAFSVNTHAPCYLAEECESINAKLIHFSTDYVFSGNSNKPYTENATCSPQSVYGESKWLGEQAIINATENYIILRISWVFSPYGKNFVKTIINLLKEKDHLRIIRDQYGCPTYTKHVAFIIQNLISQHSAISGIFHYCDSAITTWFDFANYIQNQLVEKYHFPKKEIIAITTEQYPTPAIRPKYSVLACDKILSLSDIKQYHWQQGVNETLEELLS